MAIMRSIRFAKISLAVLSLVVGLAISELILRLVAPVHLAGMSHQPAIYLKDNTTGYGYRPNSTGWMHRNFEMDNTVLINSDGFHDVDRSKERPKEILRIVAIGDSFTAAIHVPTSATWTQVLERELSNTLSVPVVVINRGLDGTGTNVHAALLASYVAEERPDIVLLVFTNNDVWDVGVKKIFREVHDGYVVTYQNEDQRSKLLNYLEVAAPSRLIRLLYRSFYTVRAAMKFLGKDHLLATNFIHQSPVDRYGDRELMQRLINAFNDLRTLARRTNSNLVVVPAPTKGNRLESSTHLGILPMEERKPLTIINVVPALEHLLQHQGLRYDQLFWKLDGHYNVVGNRVFGQALAETLEKELLSCYNRPRSGGPDSCGTLLGASEEDRVSDR